MAPRSLSQFAAERPNAGYRVAACCRIPVPLLEQVEADHGSAAPHSYAFYSEWLKTEHGIDIAPMTLRNHLSQRHAEKRSGG